MIKVSKGQVRCDDQEFWTLGRALLDQGVEIRFRASGHSMRPFIRDGDIVVARTLRGQRIAAGEVVLYRTPGDKVLLHRVIRRSRDGTQVLPKGDAARWSNEGWIDRDSVPAKVVKIERDGREWRVDSTARRWLGLAYSRLVTLAHSFQMNLCRARSFLSELLGGDTVDCRRP